ncbi:MAG: peptidase M3, partial [Alphaproteobacteria bacterium]|nr:peptidase M3 [Alphaproteobacteria bacterium]
MNNPFFEPWTAPFGAPPFDKIKPEHFQPAYDRAIAEHNAEIAAIAGNTAAPTFENTILAMEDSGRLLNKVESVFWNLTGSHTNDALQAIERDIAPVMAKHWNAIHLNAALFKRVDALFEARSTLELDGEQMRVLERYHLDFVRAGAKLSGAAR